MSEHTVDKQTMDALKALSDINLKVSEARNILVQLQENETEYLVSREKKAVDRIQTTLDSSKELVEQINKNYDTIADFARSISEGAVFLSDAQKAFRALTEAFTEKQCEWERDIKNQEETITALRNSLKVDAIRLDGDKKTVESANKKLQDDTRKLEDERGTIERTIKRLKEGRV